MGVVKKPSINDYWVQDEFVKTPFAARIMPRDRFKTILSMLHFSDNSNYIPVGEENHDPLYKIRPIYEHLQNRFQEVYTPLREVSIDEAMCPWRGKLRFKVFMKDKPVKWGIKLYELTEAVSGYVYRFEIYAADPHISNKPTDVVLRLVEPLGDKGYHLFTDNYYTCPALYEALVNQRTMCTGTVRSNRVGMPKDLAQAKLKVGDIEFRRKNDLVAVKWRDKREVTILTSAHDPTQTSTVTTRHVRDKVKPEAVVQYTKHMCGVDHNDQLLAYFPLSRRSSKWTTKMFFHFLTLSVVQASIIYNKLRAKAQLKSMKLPDFIQRLGKELSVDFITHRTLNRPAPSPRTHKPQTLLRLDRTKPHFLASLPATQAKAKPRRDCKVCYDKKASVPGKRKRAKETYYWCDECKIPLCVEPCFKLFHTKADYIHE